MFRIYAIALLLLTTQLFAREIIVNSTGDEPNVTSGTNPPTEFSTVGTVTLRSAVQFSQSSFSDPVNTILFDIPLTDPGFRPDTRSWIIRPRVVTGNFAAYEINVKRVIFNGYSYPAAAFNTQARPNTNSRFEDGTNARLSIDIRGPVFQLLPNQLFRAFRINNIPGCEFRGLLFTGFLGVPGLAAGNAIDFRYNSLPPATVAPMVIAGCFFGTDATGTSIVDPVTGEDLAVSRSVLMQPNVANAGARNVQIGGPKPEDSNLFATSLGADVLSLFSIFDTLIMRNYFGTDRTGRRIFNRMHFAIRLDTLFNFSGQNNRVEQNLIAGGSLAILIEDQNGIVANNIIGTDIDGKNALPNKLGIYFSQAANYRVVDNLISGNDTGIQVGLTRTAPMVSNVTIENCKIGTDKTGKCAIANKTGIWIPFAQGTVIDNCTISGNENEGIIISETSQNTTIKNSRIGVDSCGKKPLGNGRDGIKVGMNGQPPIVANTIIGGNSSEGNIISANEKNGIKLVAFADGNTISHNCIGGSRKKRKNTGNSKNGIFVKCSSGNTIIENNIKNNEKNGIALINSTNNVIENNEFKGNERKELCIEP